MRCGSNLRLCLAFVIFTGSAVYVELEQVLPAQAQSVDLGGSSPTNRIAITSVTAADHSLKVGWAISALDQSAQLRYRVKDVWPSHETVRPSSWRTETISGADLESAFTISDLVNGVTYEIQMRSYSDDNGYSAWSNTASAAPRPSTAVDPDVALSSLGIKQSSDGISFADLALQPSPTFSSNLTEYYLVVASTTTHLLLNPRTSAAQAVVESSVGSTTILAARSGASHQITLNAVSTTIKLEVSNAPESKSQDYILEVLRVASPPSLDRAVVGAVAGSPSATINHAAPPAGFQVGLQVKSTSESWSDSPEQFPVGVTLDLAGELAVRGVGAPDAAGVGCVLTGPGCVD